jgi:hypothetical protein
MATNLASEPVLDRLTVSPTLDVDPDVYNSIVDRFLLPKLMELSGELEQTKSFISELNLSNDPTDLPPPPPEFMQPEVIQCDICFDEFPNRFNLITLGCCNSGFCRTCVSKITNDKCPGCRTNLPNGTRTPVNQQSGSGGIINQLQRQRDAIYQNRINHLQSERDAIADLYNREFRNRSNKRDAFTQTPPGGVVAKVIAKLKTIDSRIDSV